MPRRFNSAAAALADRSAICQTVPLLAQSYSADNETVSFLFDRCTVPGSTLRLSEGRQGWLCQVEGRQGLGCHAEVIKSRLDGHRQLPYRAVIFPREANFSAPEELINTLGVFVLAIKSH